MCLANGWWCWVSQSCVASTHDLTIHRSNVREITAGLKRDREYCLVDLAWKADDIEQARYFIVPHKKPPRGQLTQFQQEENEVIASFRSKFYSIRTTICSLTQKILIFRSKHRASLQYSEGQVRCHWSALSSRSSCI